MARPVPVRNTQHFAGNPPVESRAYRDVGIHAEVSTVGEDHLNPVIAKLPAGKTVYGLINTGDLSLANARETARAPVDFVYADMEHSPLDFPGLAIFLAGVLKACKAHQVAGGITAGNADDIVRRVKEGWSIIRSTVPTTRSIPRPSGRASAKLTALPAGGAS